MDNGNLAVKQHLQMETGEDFSFRVGGANTEIHTKCNCIVNRQKDRKCIYSKQNKMCNVVLCLIPNQIVNRKEEKMSNIIIHYS